MEEKSLLIAEFATFITFLESLRALDENKWTTPLAEGKWTTRDVIAHIMLWDQYFLENAIEKIAANEEVTVQNLDFNEFNQNAVEFAKGKRRQEIIDMTVHYRSEILQLLEGLNEEEFNKVHTFGNGDQISACHYIKDFIEHDQHHIRQIEAFLA